MAETCNKLEEKVSKKEQEKEAVVKEKNELQIILDDFDASMNQMIGDKYYLIYYET
jgi:hypothetical protein